MKAVQLYLNYTKGARVADMVRESIILLILQMLIVYQKSLSSIQENLGVNLGIDRIQ